MKVAVTGDVIFWNLHFIYWRLNRLIKTPETKIEIITRGGYIGFERIGSPGCGPEILAERWAVTHGFPFTRTLAKANTAKSRRIQLKKTFRQADICIIFWDGKNSDTKGIIAIAKKVNKKVRVVNESEYK